MKPYKKHIIIMILALFLISGICAIPKKAQASNFHIGFGYNTANYHVGLSYGTGYYAWYRPYAWYQPYTWSYYPQFYSRSFYPQVRFPSPSWGQYMSDYQKALVLIQQKEAQYDHMKLLEKEKAQQQMTPLDINEDSLDFDIEMDNKEKKEAEPATEPSPKEIEVYDQGSVVMLSY